MSKGSSSNVIHAKLQRDKLRIPYSICRFLFRMLHGKICQWILSWDYPELKDVSIQFCCCRSLFKNGSFNSLQKDVRCISYCSIFLPRDYSLAWITKDNSILIATASFSVIFDVHSGKSLTQLCNIAVHVIHKLTAKSKSPIVR